MDNLQVAALISPDFNTPLLVWYLCQQTTFSARTERQYLKKNC